MRLPKMLQSVYTIEVTLKETKDTLFFHLLSLSFKIRLTVEMLANQV